VAHLRRRAAPVDVAALGPIDAVLISHSHRDHLDMASLRRLAGGGTEIVVPRGVARLVDGLGFAAVHELDPGEGVDVAGVEVTATPAEHRSARNPFAAADPCLGYLVGGDRRVYFAGDTDLFPGMESLSDRLDAALLPVWGWGPKLGPGHLDPRSAAEALTLLRPRLAVPIHWGTLFPIGRHRRNAHLLTDPPRQFAREAARLAPHVDVRILQPGRSTPLPQAR
jgi:L-ascorbate metabolism protein UlaG (beta-lactamase superfamily)